MSGAAPALDLTPEQRVVLEAWAGSQTLPHRQVVRARVILLAADGVANQVIADATGTSKPSVLKWRSRFAAAGVDGLEDACPFRRIREVIPLNPGTSWSEVA